MRWLLPLIVVAGCVTPSIPIPPPDPTRENMHFTVVGSTSTVQFNYPYDTHYIGGLAYLYDRTLQHGVIQPVNADGTTGPIEMRGAAGDQIVFSISVDQQTESTCVVAQEGNQDPNAYCQ